MTAETNQPTETNTQPELKQVLGALLFAARKPITVDELRGVLTQMDHSGADAANPFGKIQASNIRTALEQVQIEMAERKLGIILVEVAGGFRFQTDPAGGPWVRHLLNLDKPARLSKPALETLAIIAYRQPTTRAEIEALRGVNVDAMMRHLLELQLIRIMGRSDLPGRPLMYGTTQLFLEHFGLGSVKNLPGVEQLSRRDAERVRRESEDGRQMTDDGRQTTDTSPEKTEDGVKTDDGLPAVAPSEVEGAQAGRQPAHRLVPRSFSEGGSPEGEGVKTDDGPEKTEDVTTDDGRRMTDDRQRKAEEADEGKDEDEDADADEDEDEDEDDDDEGRG